jgi:lipopolysaccharide transport system ATP-binding protein
MERPLKEYSSGMYVRLAFATAIHVDPEILIVDEALAVGDARFANRCLRKFDELKARGVTILFVSHDLGLVKRLADRALLLIQGRMELLGSPKEAVDRYISLVQTPDAGDTAPVAARHGDGSCRIDAVELPFGPVARPGDSVRIDIRVTARDCCDPLVVGILIRNRLGMDIAGTNTRIEGVPAAARAGESLLIRFEFECRLARGEYAVTVAAQHENGMARDWIDDAVLFTVADARDLAGSIALNPTVQVIQFR